MGGRIGALHSTSLGVKIPLMICVPPCVCVSCREMLLQVVSGSQLVVCYKAKDLLRTALQHYRPDLHWKQCNFDKAVKNSLQLSSVGIWDYNIILLCSFPPPVSSCRVQDPQVAAWLLDPADPSSCFTNLLTKHCRTPPRTPTPALGARKVCSTKQYN